MHLNHTRWKVNVEPVLVDAMLREDLVPCHLCVVHGDGAWFQALALTLFLGLSSGPVPVQFHSSDSSVVGVTHIIAWQRHEGHYALDVWMFSYQLPSTDFHALKQLVRLEQ